MELSDQKVWELSRLLFDSFRQEQVQQKLDVDHLYQFRRRHVKPLYPHKLNEEGDIQKFSCKEACCVLDPGYFCCCNTTKPDNAFKKFGTGVCLYFKFMKHSMSVLMLILVISLLATLLCIWVANQNNFDVTQNYSSFLFSTTLGVFSAEKTKCAYGKINSNTNVTNLLSFPYSVTADLSCPHGRVSYFGSVFSNTSSSSLYGCRLEVEKVNTSTDLTTPFIDPASEINTCSGNAQTCTVSMDLSTNFTNSATVSFGFACLDQVYYFGSQVNSSTLFYLLIAADLLICVILIIFYMSESFAQKQQIQYFKNNQLSLNDFSLKIKGFTALTYERQLELFLKTLRRELGEGCLDEIVQIKTPDRIDFIQYQVKKEEVYKNLYNFISQQFFEVEINPSQFKSQTDFVNNCYSHADKYQKFKDQLVKLTAQYLKQIYVPTQEQNEDKNITSIYFVFSNVKMKKRVYQLQDEGCFSRYLQIQHNRYTVKSAPAPDLILWKNKGKRALPRICFSWFLTLLVCFGSYVLFAFIQLEQQNLLSTYNFDLNCGVLFQSSQLITFDSILNSTDQNYFNCFCQANLFNFDPQYDTCSDYRVQYATYLAIPIVVSLLLVIYNVAVKYLFKLFTILEAHKLITNELYSYTIKRAFLFIMNMGLIIILINTQYNQQPSFLSQFRFLVQGKYKDISADWYLNIGSIIILTLFFNVSFPIIELAFATLIKCFRHCWDRKCCFRKTSCKTKEEYIDLFSNDIYPIEQRYAFLIAIYLITLAFSCVIPFLFIICSISVILLYIIDKVLIFKLYQTPLNYNAELQTLLRKTIYFGLVIHMALTAVFLSQSQLIAQNSTIPESSQLDLKNDRMNAIIHTSYIIPYVILFLLLAGWLIFDNTIIAILRKCALLCRKNLSQITKYKLSQDYYQSINYFQLAKLKRITQNALNKVMVKNQDNRVLSIELFTNFNDTIKDFKEPEKVVSEHEKVLKRILHKINSEETLRRREDSAREVFLIGMPGYEIMMNDQVFDQNKRNMILTESLHHCLKDIADAIKNEDL